MKANIINLEHRQDRLNEIKIECKREGLEVIRHDGVNGQVAFFKEADNRRMRGHYGCLQSFRNVLKSVKGSADYHLIMEDDVILTDGFVESVRLHMEEAPEDMKILYLGGHLHTLENATEDYNELFYRAKNVLGLYCWIIKDEYVDNLLSVFESRLWKADILAIEFQQLGGCYMTKKCHAWIRESYSDILHKFNNPNLKY